MSAIKIFLCGYGSIGQKHAQNLKTLDADIKIWRARADQGEQIQQDGFVFEPSLDDGIEWCDGIVIATATDEHIPLAMRAAQAQKAIYLEKPVSLNQDGLNDLRLATENLIVEVGCQMRQHPNLKTLHARILNGNDGKVLAFQAWVGQRLDEWRPGTDYRTCYSADATRGGGALFDLVHEVDLMVWLVGHMQNVMADLRHNSDLEMKAEDLANVILVAENGAAGTVQLDMLSPAYRRGLQIICERAIYRWDMVEGSLWRAEGREPAAKIDTIAQDYHPSNMLHDAMENFLKRIDDPVRPASCSLADGCHALDILLAARQSHESGCRKTLEGTSS